MEKKGYQQEVEVYEQPHRFFAFKSANEWMKEASDLPQQKHLFGELWFENEAAILFADTNAGKSILAVQIADCVSRGESCSPFVNDAGPQRILYFDFELSQRQFGVRYSVDGNDCRQWSENFIRVEIDADAEYPAGDYCQYICDQIEQLMLRSGATAAIIDNITYLGEELEKSKGALPLMKRLKEIKRRNNFSFLILAHCPKRSASRPITKNDINGSMMIMNFVDAAFAIGMSRQGTDVRYLKQVKVRNAGFTYGAESVLNARIVKEWNFLHFQFLGTSREVEHLEKADPMEKEERLQLIRDYYADGKSARGIAQEMGISHTQVNRLLKEMFDDGSLKKRGNGTVPNVTDVPEVPHVPDGNNGNCGNSGNKNTFRSTNAKSNAKKQKINGKQQ